MQYLKIKYPSWYIPWLSLTLRTSKIIAETYTRGTKYEINLESRLNGFLEVPQHIQNGPSPEIVSVPLGNTFSECLITVLMDKEKYLKYPNDNILFIFDSFITRAKLNDEEINNALQLCQTNFPHLCQLVNNDVISEKGNVWKYVLICIIIATLMKCKRNPPLIWNNSNDTIANSDENKMKKWIQGKLKCDLITDMLLIPGYEASTVIRIARKGSYDRKDCFNAALSRSMVQYIEIKY